MLVRVGEKFKVRFFFYLLVSLFLLFSVSVFTVFFFLASSRLRHKFTQEKVNPNSSDTINLSPHLFFDSHSITRNLRSDHCKQLLFDSIGSRYRRIDRFLIAGSGGCQCSLIIRHEAQAEEVIGSGRFISFFFLLYPYISTLMHTYVYVY